MPFNIDKNDKRSLKKIKSAIEPIDTEFATALANWVKKQKITKTGPIKLPDWSLEFSKLRKDHSPDKIRKVLDWFIQNNKLEFCPVCQSASSFRRKFDQVQDAMRRSGDDPDILEINDKARMILSRLKRYYFPPGFQRGLPIAVQKSLDNYTKFFDAIPPIELELSEAETTIRQLGGLASIDNKEKRLRLIKERDLFRFLEMLRGQQLIIKPIYFVEHWFIELSAHFSRQEKWTAGIKVSSQAYIFRLDSEHFLSKVCLLCNNYCGSLAYWDQLLERIDHAES